MNTWCWMCHGVRQIPQKNGNELTEAKEIVATHSMVIETWVPKDFKPVFKKPRWHVRDDIRVGVLDVGHDIRNSLKHVFHAVAFTLQAIAEFWHERAVIVEPLGHYTMIFTIVVKQRVHWLTPLLTNEAVQIWDHNIPICHGYVCDNHRLPQTETNRMDLINLE